MFRKAERKPTDAELLYRFDRMEKSISERAAAAQRDLEALAARLTDRVLAAIREASAPAPGVRVFMRAPYGDPIEYPAATAWEAHPDGLLVVRRADGRADATFASGAWVGAERITPEPTKES